MPHISFLSRLSQPKVVTQTAQPPTGGAAGSAKLAFMMLRQSQTQWCWAAVSTSVSRFFNALSSWTECKVANKAWTRSDCCSTGASGPCNQPWYLDQALSIVGVFGRMTSATEPFSTVKSEIGASRPLCLRVGWFGGGGHFLAIVGWQETASGAHFYHVDDPIYGSQRIGRSKLETRYQGTGTWTHSYFVVNSSAAGGAVAALTKTEFPEALGA